MPAVLVEISRFVDEHFPGFVECTLVDARGERHRFVEKAPVVSTANLTPASRYPQRGSIQCRIDSEWQDGQLGALVRVSTAEPFHIESAAGDSEFVVLASQLQQ